MIKERRQRARIWIEHPELLAEMFYLRFNEGWSLRDLGKKYDVDHVGLSKRCKDYMKEHPEVMAPKVPTVRKAYNPIAPVQIEKPQYIISDLPARKPRFPINDGVLRDEFGERINRGRSYKEYLAEQYPNLSLKKIRARNREKDL